jgi:HEAT repeat protein
VNSPVSYWEVVVEFVGDSDDRVRNEAAVALEQLAAPKSYRSISTALRKEKVMGIEKNLLRALGASGAEEKSARTTLLKVAKKDREPLLRANAIVSLGYLLRDEEVVEFLTETFRSGVPRERAAAAIAMGLSREEEWLEVLDPGRAAREEGADDEGEGEPEEDKDAAESEPLELEKEVASAVEAAKRVLSDGGLAPLERPMGETAEDELRRERLFSRGGGRGEGDGRGEDGGGRGGGGRGGRGGEDPEDETGKP